MSDNIVIELRVSRGQHFSLFFLFWTAFYCFLTYLIFLLFRFILSFLFSSFSSFSSNGLRFSFFVITLSLSFSPSFPHTFVLCLSFVLCVSGTLRFVTEKKLELHIIPMIHPMEPEVCAYSKYLYSKIPI